MVAWYATPPNSVNPPGLGVDRQMAHAQVSLAPEAGSTLRFTVKSRIAIASPTVQNDALATLFLILFY